MSLTGASKLDALRTDGIEGAPSLDPCGSSPLLVFLAGRPATEPTRYDPDIIDGHTRLSLAA